MPLKFRTATCHRPLSVNGYLSCLTKQQLAKILHRKVIASSILPGQVDKSVHQSLYKRVFVPESQPCEYLPSDVPWSCDQHTSGGSFSISGLLRETVGPAIDVECQSVKVPTTLAQKMCGVFPSLLSPARQRHIFVTVAVSSLLTARCSRNFHFAMLVAVNVVKMVKIVEY